MRYRKMKFKQEYLKLLKLGRKRTTIRMEKKYRLGEVVYIADTNGKIYGKALIEDVKVKRLMDLSDSDAVIDGFKNLADLLITLKDIYGDIPRDQKLYIFSLKILNWSRDPLKE